MPDFDRNLQPVIKQDTPQPIKLNVAPSKQFDVLFTPPNSGGVSDLSQKEDIFTKIDRLSKNRFGEKGVFVTNAELDANKRYSAYNPTITDYEDFAAYGQSNLDKAANGVLKGANLAATTFGGSVAMLLYGIPKSIYTGKLSAIWDNEITRELDKWNTKVDQEYLPNYYTNVEQNADWYARDNWFKTNFLFDKLIKNAGFAVGAMYSGNLANTGLLLAFSKIGSAAIKGASLAEASQAFKLFTPMLRSTARAFSVGKNIEAAQVLESQISSIADLTRKSSEISKIAQGVSAFNKVNDISRKAAIALYSSAGEASFEALHTSKEYRNSLIEDFKLNNYGKEPDATELAKIDDLASSVGKTSFLGNMALLSVTEYLQLPYLLGSSYKNSRKAANAFAGKTDDILSEAGQFKAKVATTKFGKMYKGGTSALGFVLDPKEGFQELGQFALQVGTQNYFNKAYQTNAADIWTDGFLHGFVGENEVGEGVGALNTKEGAESFVLGAITGGLMQAKGKYQEGKTTKANTQKLVSALNSSPTFKEAFKDRLNSINRSTVLQQQQQDAVIQGDELEARDLGDDLLHNYLSTRIKYGRFDMVMADLADVQMESMTPEGLATLKQQGVAALNDTSQTFQKRVSAIQDSAKVIEQLYESASVRFSGKYSNGVIDKMVYAAYKIHAYDQRIPTVTSELSNDNIDVSLILDDIINKNKPNKEATDKALEEINKTGIRKDELKTYLSDVIELSLRRKSFLDEYQDIKANPDNYKSDFEFGESEELDVSILQKTPGKRKFTEKSIEVGKEYSLQEPVLRQGNKLSVSPKLTVLSQTLGGEYEVRLPDGTTTFLTPKDFSSYNLSETDHNISPKLSELLNKAIAKVIAKKKFESLNIPEGASLNIINSLDNKELTDDIQKEFKKSAQDLIKKEAEDNRKSERLKKYSQQIKDTQKEISKLSDDLATRTEGEVKKGSNIFESMKKAFQYLFTTTTTASSDWEKGPIPPHIQRLNTFMNRAKNLKSRSKLKLILVTQNNEEFLGLKGLAELSFKAGNLDMSTAKDPLNGFVGAVFIEVDGNERYFIDADGARLGKVGSQVRLDSIIFSTMPGVNLFYSDNSPRYRDGQKDEAVKQATAYQGFREKLFKTDPTKYNMYEFGISKGIPNEAKPVPEENPIGDVLIDENQLDKTLVLEVVTKGSISHEDGNNYTFPNGTVVFRNADDLIPIYNRKLDSTDAETVYSVLKALSDEVNESLSEDKTIFLSPDYLSFLRNVMYFTDAGEKSNNKIYLEEDKLHIGDNVYDFANIENHKDQIIAALSETYFNVNKKTLSTNFKDKFIEFYSENGKLKKREWVNYQTYLLSSKYPDGSSRKLAPVYTTVSKPTTLQPNAFKQKYAIIPSLGEEFPQIVVVPGEKKTETGGKYTWDGKTKNTIAITINRGTPQQKDVNISFTGVLEDGVPSITIISDKETIASLNEAATAKATVTASKVALESAGVDLELDLDISDESTLESSVIILQNGLPYLLKEKIKKELAIPVPETKEVKVESGVTPIKLNLNKLKGADTRLAQNGKVTRISDAEIELFKTWAAKNVPNIPFEFLENIIKTHDNKLAWGIFEGGVAKIFKRGQRGTEYHETFEAVWKAYLGEPDQQELLAEFRSNKGSFTDRASGRKIDYNEATDFQAKERIADDFAEYMVGKLPARDLKERIKRFFKAIMDFFKSFVLNTKLKDSLFVSIDTGAFKNTPYPDVPSDYSAPAEIAGLTSVQTKDIVQHITARIFQITFANKDSLFNIGNFTSNQLFGEIKQELIDVGFFDRVPEDIYPQLVEATKDYLRTFNIEFDEESKLVINDPEANKNDYANEAFTVNFKKSSPFSVKLLLGTLVNTGKINQESKSELEEVSADTDMSSIGGFTLVPFGQSFNLLINNLSNTRDVNHFVDKLFDIVKKNSDYIRLFKRLGGNLQSGKINFSAYGENEWRLFVQFYQVFTKQKPEGIIQYIDGKNVYSSAANQATSVREIQRKWFEDMKLLSTDKDSIVFYNKKEKTFTVNKDSTKYKSINIKSPEDKISYLAMLGIDFPLSTFNRLKGKKLKDFGDAVSGIYISLDKSGVIKSIKGKDLDATGHINTLASLYVSINSPYEDTTFFNNSGKQQQSFTDANALSLFEYNFNSSPTLESLLEKMPELGGVFSTNSQILKKGGSFFNEAGERISEMKIKYILGNKDVNSNTGDTIAELTAGQRLMLEINQNLSGDYYVIVPGDGSTEWMMSLGNSVPIGSSAYSTFHGYLIDDILLAQNHKNTSKTLNIGKKAKTLRFSAGILSEKVLTEANKLVDDNATITEINAFIEANVTEINKDIDAFIESTVKDTKDALLYSREIYHTDENHFAIPSLENNLAEQFGINKDHISEQQLNDLLIYVNNNYIINNVEYHKIIFGDPFQYEVKIKKGKLILDETKRIKSFLSPRRITFNSPEFNSFLNKELNKVGNTTLTSNDFGFHHFKDFVRSVVVQDNDVVGSLANFSPAYANTNEADAASWMMDNSYREVKIKNGQWSEEAEEFHQWQMAFTRQNIPGYKYTSPALEKHDKALVEKPVPQYVIEVLKPIVSGTQYLEKDLIVVLHKFSQMPIYYSAVKGTNLEDLYIKMFKEGADYVITKSGSKVGTKSMHNLYTQDGKFNKDPFNNFVDVPWSVYGIQVENSFEKEKFQTRGSQITKLATLDLFDNGSPITEQAGKEAENNKRLLDLMHQNGYKELLNKLGISDVGSSYHLTDKSKVAETLRNEMLRRQMSENGIDSLKLDPMTGEFKIPFEASNSYRQIKDILYSMVDKAIASPKMGGFPAVQVPVTMFETGSRSLAMKNSEGKYEKLSKEEYYKLSEEAKSKVVITDDTLKFYEDGDGKRYCEVLLPNWLKKQFSKKKFPTDEFILAYLNKPENSKILMGIGFRIPTQALSSIEVFKIKGFLPEYMGRTVVVPSEITTKAGSDFDIDKLNMYLKSVYTDAKGNVKLVELHGSESETKEFYAEIWDKKLENKRFKKNELLEAMQILSLQLDDPNGLVEKYADTLNRMVEESDDEFMAQEVLLKEIENLNNAEVQAIEKERYVNDMYKKGLENAYYESLQALLTLPENFSRLTSANTDTELADIADNLDKLRGDKEAGLKNKLLNRVFISTLRHTFITGKRWIGRVAVNITGHSLTQKSSIFVKDSTTKVSVPHNTVLIDGKKHISMSGILDQAGKHISDKLSMYANASVDIVKDPYLLKIIYSDRLTGTFLFMERIGVPMKQVALILNQPIVREYVNYLDSMGVSPFVIEDERTVKTVKNQFPSTTDEILTAQIDSSITSLSDNIYNYSKGSMTSYQNAQQHAILDEFFTYFKLADASFKLTMATNYDTTSFKNADDLFRKQLMTEVAQETNPISSPEKMLSSSFIGEEAVVLDKASDALGAILKFNLPEFREVIGDAIYPYAKNIYLSKDKFSRIAEKLTASFLDYVVQIKANMNLEDLLVDSSRSVARQLKTLQQNHSNEIRILNDLEVVSDRVEGAKSVKLRVNLKDAYDENLYIGYMRELRNHPAAKTFYPELVKLAVLQGTYQSAISIKNIIPLEDFAAVVSPIISKLSVDEDVRAFVELNSFQKNNWKDQTVVPKITPKFYANDEDLIGLDINDADIYQYHTKAFPNIEALGVKSGDRRVLLLHPRSKGASYDVITVPKVLSVGGEMVDFLTGRTITRTHYAQRRLKGEDMNTVYGYQAVKDSDGNVISNEKGYLVYKMTNLLGDGQYAVEHYVYPSPSVIDNGTFQVIEELPTDLIINYFEPKALEPKVVAPPVVIPITEKKYAKISLPKKAGKKTKYTLTTEVVTEEREGYRIIVSEYPNAVFYLYRPDKSHAWQIDNVNTGKTFPVMSTTLNEMVLEFQEKINNFVETGKNIDILKTAGLFDDESNSKTPDCA